MVTALLDRSGVIIQLMARGHLSLGQSSPCLVTHGIQTPKTKPTKSPSTRYSSSSYAFKLTLPPFVEPPIPGPSQFSKSQVPSHEDALTFEPEPEVTPTQSTEDSFGKLLLSFFSCFQHSLTPPLTISSSSHYPRSILIIDNMPIGSPLHLPLPHSSTPPCALPLPLRTQPPLIPMMRLCRSSPTCNQP
ncbi:hypothetical protein O181_008357 [Austropuccinia psidii MF-1]|uniref:Uncharacterized protein n=1 Tax=Austropuccinia psidii MF-1 TaxID=1389203 RepID=A0A9Q3GJB5_9BASI|nr:hypothetical protein [Austropuccinia psidii MF-1]